MTLPSCSRLSMEKLKISVNSENIQQKDKEFLNQQINKDSLSYTQIIMMNLVTFQMKPQEIKLPWISMLPILSMRKLILAPLNLKLLPF